MRRLALGGFIVGVVLLAQLGPAAAHEEINPSSFPTGKPVFFTLDAANEATADLVKVTLTAPATVAFGATTRAPAGWTVNRTDQVIIWSGGAVKPDQFEQWGFEIEGADQPGTLTYKATLGFADGKSDDVTVDVTAVAAGVGGSAGSAASGGSSSRADAALVVGVAALALAIAALVLASRRGRPATAAAGTAAAPEVAAEQDW